MTVSSLISFFLKKIVFNFSFCFWATEGANANVHGIEAKQNYFMIQFLFNSYLFL